MKNAESLGAVHTHIYIYIYNLIEIKVNIDVMKLCSLSVLLSAY